MLSPSNTGEGCRGGWPSPSLTLTVSPNFSSIDRTKKQSCNSFPRPTGGPGRGYLVAPAGLPTLEGLGEAPRSTLLSYRWR